MRTIERQLEIEKKWILIYGEQLMSAIRALSDDKRGRLDYMNLVHVQDKCKALDAFIEKYWLLNIMLTTDDPPPDEEGPHKKK